MNDPYIARSTRLGTCTLGGEAIIITPSDSQLYNLNQVATSIWEAADGQSRLSEIVEKNVCVEFDIDRETAMADAWQFVSDFSTKGLLLTSDRPFDPVKVAQPFVEDTNA